jgi:mono/diheme cytochrome c family protein
MRVALVVCAAAVLVTAAAAQTPGAASSRGPGAYRVECPSPELPEARCVVDDATYVGWRVFASHCASCHAEGGLGSDFAPALAPRIRRLSFAQFRDLLDEGYMGLDGVLPAWGQNRDIARYYGELWAYLSARAAGDLPPGPPARQTR